MAKRYDMATKTGSYTGRDGEQKSRYEYVGEVHDGHDGGFYARVNPFRMLGVCMAAIARGDDSMLVSLFAPRQEQSAPTATGNAQAHRHQSRQAPPPQPDFDDDIPF